MNTQQANAIPMSEIMESIGHLPVKNSNNLDLWYYSPFRKEKTPSFHVNAVKNVWYDFGDGIGGTVVDFICTYLAHTGEDSTVRDALRWLKNMTLAPSPLIDTPEEEKHAPDNPPLLMVSVSDLHQPALLYYLRERGIPLNLARTYLKEALLYNGRTRKQFSTLCLQNEDDGYELRSRFFKGCIGPKSISFVRGSKTSQGDIHVFEGFMDFLSALTYQQENRFEDDAIILNSVHCLPLALTYIKTCPYNHIRAWLDNDPAGEKATHTLRAFAEKECLAFKNMNRVYAPHKDVNAWHVRMPRL
jgi:hypothetical protein